MVERMARLDRPVRRTKSACPQTRRSCSDGSRRRSRKLCQVQARCAARRHGGRRTASTAGFGTATGTGLFHAQINCAESFDAEAGRSNATQEYTPHDENAEERRIVAPHFNCITELLRWRASAKSTLRSCLHMTWRAGARPRLSLLQTFRSNEKAHAGSQLNC